MVVNASALTMRDGEGKLLPMEIESKIFGGGVKLLPMKDGDFNALKVNAAKAKDEDIIEKHLFEPKLTKEQIEDLPRLSKIELVKMILMTTGITREEVDRTVSKALENAEEKLKKK